MKTKNCDHAFEAVRWKYFVRCETCGRWRLRTKNEVFYKWIQMPPVRLVTDGWRIAVQYAKPIELGTIVQGEK